MDVASRPVKLGSEGEDGQAGGDTDLYEPSDCDDGESQERDGRCRVVRCAALWNLFFQLMQVDLSVPDHTTISRRLKRLEVALPVAPTSGKRHVVVDSTGVKVYGEGEWKTRQHGISKRRTWRKLHLAVDEATGEILASAVTDNSCHDGEMLGGLLDEITDPISQVDADGAYDTGYCYDFIEARGAVAGIPPQRNAKIWFHGNRKTPRHPRDENLRRIRLVGRAKWKREIGYHRRFAG